MMYFKSGEGKRKISTQAKWSILPELILFPTARGLSKYCYSPLDGMPTNQSLHPNTLPCLPNGFPVLICTPGWEKQGESKVSSPKDTT